MAQRGDVINHSEAARYVAPEEPILRERLEWFQDQKLALMVHWGPYSQLGIFESWPVSDGDAEWSRKFVDWETDGKAFRKQYFGMNRSFNPVRFLPDQWADFAKESGFRYLIFTTKHHDGFCMFDTRETDYKTTAPDCPYHDNPNADIARALFDAFRARGLGIAAYFSKPDWHCPWYWAEGCEKPVAADRNPTYDPAARPDLWNEYVRFTHAQMMELVERYGKLDVLWLDGGQVNPILGQDARIGELAARARAVQPWLLFADRTVGGPYENYITPEQQVPGEYLPVPWESCVTIGTGFSYRYDDTYKTPRALVRLLTDVIARGGNLALNIGAQPDGRLAAGAVKSARGLGEWLRENGEAVYGTRACPPYTDGQYAFTQKDGTVYAILRLDEGERPGSEIEIPLPRGGRARLIKDGRALEAARTANGLRVALPEDVASLDTPALVIAITE